MSEQDATTSPGGQSSARFPLVDFDRGDYVSIMEDDPYPSARYELEQHLHVVREDRTDSWLTLPVRAVVVDGVGPAVEIGPYSVSPHEARMLADGLLVLADLADPHRVDGPMEPPAGFPGGVSA